MCGIIGIYSDNYIYYSYIIELLKKLQHRGKDAYGISFYKKYISNPKIYWKYKKYKF